MRTFGWKLDLKSENDIVRGRVKKIWKIPYRVLTPPCYGKKIFFSETRPFFENFLKKVYFHPRKPQKKIEKSSKNWKNKTMLAMLAKMFVMLVALRIMSAKVKQRV